MENTNKKSKHIQSILDWQKRNPEKFKSYQKISRERNKDKIRIKRIEWSKHHRDVLNAGQRAWRSRNKDKVKLYGLNYKLAHPLMVKFRKYKYAAPKRGYEFSLSYEDFKKLLSDSFCYYCKASGKLGLDRVNNRIGYRLDNVVPCCWKCNRMKRCFSKESFINICIAVAKNHNLLGRDY